MPGTTSEDTSFPDVEDKLHHFTERFDNVRDQLDELITDVREGPDDGHGTSSREKLVGVICSLIDKEAKENNTQSEDQMRGCVGELRNDFNELLQHNDEKQQFSYERVGRKMQMKMKRRRTGKSN